MKTNLLNTIAVAIVMTTCYNCSVEPIDNSQTQLLEEQSVIYIEQAVLMDCDGSDPKVRITNNGTLPADYYVFGNNGVLINVIYDVIPGTVADWTTFPEGNVVIDVKIDTLPDQKVIYAMIPCTELNMEIDTNNQLTNATPQASTN